MSTLTTIQIYLITAICLLIGWISYDLIQKRKIKEINKVRKARGVWEKEELK